MNDNAEMINALLAESLSGDEAGILVNGKEGGAGRGWAGAVRRC